jgi:hypothetical protein
MVAAQIALAETDWPEGCEIRMLTMTIQPWPCTWQPEYVGPPTVARSLCRPTRRDSPGTRSVPECR